MLNGLVLKGVPQKEDEGNQYSISSPRNLSSLTQHKIIPRIIRTAKYRFIQNVEAIVN